MWQKNTQGQHTAHIFLALPAAHWAVCGSQHHAYASPFFPLIPLILSSASTFAALQSWLRAPTALCEAASMTEGAYGGGRGQGGWMLALLIFYLIVNQSYWLWSLPIIASSPGNYRLQGLCFRWEQEGAAKGLVAAGAEWYYKNALLFFPPLENSTGSGTHPMTLEDSVSSGIGLRTIFECLGKIAPSWKYFFFLWILKGHCKLPASLHCNHVCIIIHLLSSMDS